MMKLYGALLSPYVRKVQLALFYKGLSFELVPINPGSWPEGYSELHPLKKMPALTDGSFSLPDSSAILAYLDRKYPQQPLFPQAAEDYGFTVWFEEYCDSRLTEATGGLCFQRLLGPKFFGRTPDPAVIKVLLDEKLPLALAYPEKVIAGGEPVRGRFSAADLGLITNLFNLIHAGYEIGEAYPKLRAYMAWMKTLPIVSKELEIETKLLSRI